MTAQGLWWEGQGGDLQNRMRMMIRLTCMFTTHGSDCGLPGQRFGRLPQRETEHGMMVLRHGGAPLVAESRVCQPPQCTG